MDRLEQLAAAGDWTAASELVAGEFLEGFGVPDATDFEDWLAAEREQWRGRSVEVLVRCADHLTRVARPQDAAAVAGRALAIEPTSEAALRAALRSRSLAGDRAGALELAERFHARLAELGVQPAAETSAMVERVRRERGVRREVQTDSAEDLAVARPPLGGRVEELARLLDVAARSARTGRAALVLLEGEAGVGKSRLLDEMLALLRLDGTAGRRRAGGRGRPVRSVERCAGARAGRPARRTGRGRRHAVGACRARRGPAGMGGAIPRRGLERRDPARAGRWRRRCARPRPSSPWCSRWTMPSGSTTTPPSRSARCCATSRLPRSRSCS